MGIDDVNLNGTLIAAAELLGCILTLYCSKFGIKRLSLFRICAIIQMCICLAIYSLLLESQSRKVKFIVTLLVCFIRCINSLGYFVYMVYVVELFETKNRMIGSALTLSFSFAFIPLWIIMKDYLVD